MNTFDIEQYKSWEELFGDMVLQGQPHDDRICSFDEIEPDTTLQFEGFEFVGNIQLKPRIAFIGVLIVPRFKWRMPFRIQRAVLDRMNYAEWWNDASLRDDHFIKCFRMFDNLRDYDFSGTPQRFMEVMRSFQRVLVMLMVHPKRDDVMPELFNGLEDGSKRNPFFKVEASF